MSAKIQGGEQLNGSKSSFATADRTKPPITDNPANCGTERIHQYLR
ncbi:MAG: hypothetical protein U0Y96_07065 [Candidatus Kapaibacterium sp.]